MLAEFCKYFLNKFRYLLLQFNDTWVFFKIIAEPDSGDELDSAGASSPEKKIINKNHHSKNKMDVSNS